MGLMKYFDSDATPDWKDLDKIFALQDETFRLNQRETEAQTLGNRVNQTTPWGSVSWGREQITDPLTGEEMYQWDQNVELPEVQQDALNKQQAQDYQSSELGFKQAAQLNQQLGAAPEWDTAGNQTPYKAQDFETDAGLEGDINLQDLDYTGAREVGDPAALRQEATDRFYNQGARRLDPRFAQEGEALEVKLRGQGLAPGDQAYDNAMQNFTQSKNDAYANLSDQSFLSGRGEADAELAAQMGVRGMDTAEMEKLLTSGNLNEAQKNQLFNQIQQQKFGNVNTATGAQNQAQLEEANFADTQRNQRLAEMMMERNQLLNEASALKTGAQVGQPGFQGYNTATKSEAPNYMQGYGVGQTDAVNQSNASTAAMSGLMSGFSSLAGGASDLKGAFG